MKSDEIWYYHHGHALTVHMIFSDGKYKPIKLGLGEGEYLQYTVPAHVIFGSSIDSDNEEDFAVVSCMVSPAFDYEDFELFTQQQLLELYPQHQDIIYKLAYEKIPEV